MRLARCTYHVKVKRSAPNVSLPRFAAQATGSARCAPRDNTGYPPLNRRMRCQLHRSRQLTDSTTRYTLSRPFCTSAGGVLSQLHCCLSLMPCVFHITGGSYCVHWRSPTHGVRHDARSTPYWRHPSNGVRRDACPTICWRHPPYGVRGDACSTNYWRDPPHGVRRNAHSTQRWRHASYGVRRNARSTLYGRQSSHDVR